MNKVFLDDGHGTATAGKRTPTLPGGSVTKENDFNRKVINKRNTFYSYWLKNALLKCGKQKGCECPLHTKETFRF